QKRNTRLGFVGPTGARHLRIAELPLECREEIERIAAAVRSSDLAFLLAEENGKSGLVFRISPTTLRNLERRAGKDQVCEIYVAQAGTEADDVVAPGLIKVGVSSHRLESALITKPVAGDRLELVDEEASGGNVTCPILGLTLED